MAILASTSQKLKVHLVCYENVDAWILGRFALKLRDELLARHIRCDISNKADPAADINHHINYYPYDGRRTTTETIMVTHIDSDSKLKRVQWQLIEAEMGVCMSAETVDTLARHGIPRHKLCFVHPAHDGTISPRKTMVGITTRIYSDGCKREGMLLELAESISPKDFAFRIMGTGWNSIVSQLRAGGFEIDYFDQFDREHYKAFMPMLDYYLYFGLDEGSMGFLDALAAGVRTIVPAHGFHLDAKSGITHPFIDGPQLKSIFSAIAAERSARQQAVADWTWPEYARKHHALWEYLLARNADCQVPEALRLTLENIGVVVRYRSSTLETANSKMLASGLRTKWKGRFKFRRSTAVRSHLPFRRGVNEYLAFMNYLVGVGARRAAVRVALRAIATKPLDFNLWRGVIPIFPTLHKTLRHLKRLYKKLALRS